MHAIRFGLAAFAAAAVSAPIAMAQPIIAPGLYRLNNHPDGNAAAPFYGLRLDELKNITDGKDIFTFDFDHPDSFVTLNYTGSTIVISGPVFGGLDIGSEYAPDPALTGIYNVSFTYSVGVGIAPGDDDIVAAPPSDMLNTGSITTPGGEVIGLWDKADGGFTFRLGDEDNDNGHRGHNGVSGWGWLNHTVANQHKKASDWLFTLDTTPVPAPASMALAGVGALLIARRRR